MAKAQVVAVANQKGGVGKTTTCLALASGLTAREYKVLVVDLDSQMNCSYALNADTDSPTIFDVLTSDVPVAEAIQHTESGDLVPADSQLAIIDAILNQTGKEYRLKEEIEPVLPEYDFIVLDTPPSLGLLTLMALTACHYAIITAQADAFSLQGVGQLQQTIESVKKYTNHNLIVLGILLTRYRTRTAFADSYADVAGQLAELVHTKVFDSHIREAIAIQEAEDRRVPILTYKPKANVSKDYERFIDEFLKGV